jgi:hypothetical protein
MSMHLRRGTTALISAFALLIAVGCYNPFSPKLAPNVGVSEVAPSPTSPRGLLDLFSWCYNNRAYDEYTEIFTDDFQFQFSAADTTGQVFGDRGLFRQDELDTARHLFIEGTANEPPAQKIVLSFDRTFLPEPDSRPGKTYPVHQEIKRNVVLSIDTGDQAFRITGAARFFVVRGDSAKIPEDLVQRGFRPDKNRWYIERWEDETIDTGGGALIAQVGGASAMKQAIATALAREGAASTARTAAVPAAATGTATYGVTWGWMQAFYLR